MDAKQGTKQGPRTYTDFEPSFEWSRGQESDILRLHLPGFKRENIKVQVDNHGTLRSTGERAVEGNNWRRFGKDFRIPKNSKVNGIRAKFESETLSITIPKETTQTQPTTQNKLSAKEKSKPALDTAPTPAPAPAPIPALIPAPSAPAPRGKPTSGKLGDLFSAEKEDQIVAKIEEEKVEKKEDKSVKEKLMEMPHQKVAEAVKEEIQSRRAAGSRNTRKMLILNVIVAILVLVGIGFYSSFKLKSGVLDEDHGEEL